MSEIVIWNEGEYNRERIDEFKAKYSGAEENAELEHGCLPEGTGYFISATDGGVDTDGLYHMGSYYRAYIVLDGRMYEVEVTNGDAPAEYGEFVISSMAVNDTLQEEYWKGSIYN